MALETGARLGPYEITGKLGVGGMGEVYRAHDTRLNREVAIKILKPEVSNDPARRARFEQEARAAAALNHPNIVSLYDVGTQDSALYLVTELVPGDTLDVILAQGSMPIKRLLDIAVQVADGMAAAHALPLTHRDLKPANVIVTPEGRAKILDFGLAKMGRSDGRGEDATLTAALTQDGQVLGTVYYMSPEQATGKEVDTRSDQFSFGAILHEMVTGKKPFARDSMVQTMSAIVTDDAPVIEREIPAPLRWIITRCLSKAPVDRYQSTRDLFLELRSLKEHLSDLSTTQVPALEVIESPAPPPARSSRKLALGFALGAAVTAAVALLVLRGSTSKPQTHSFTPFSFEAGGNYSPVWSPDGKGVAFAARQVSNGPSQLYVRYLDASIPTPLMQVGVPIAWTKSGRIVFTSNNQPAGLWTISPVGGQPEPLLALDPNVWGSADVSPDGSAAAFFDKDKDGQYGVMISSPAGTPAKLYAPAPFASRDIFNNPSLKFSRDGKQLLLLRNGGDGEQLWLLPYPANPSSPPHRILEKLPQPGGTPVASWMPDNRRLVLSMSDGAGPSQLYIADTVSGDLSVLSSGTTTQSSPAVSPDGTKLIFMEATSDSDLASMDLATAAVTPQLSTSRNESMPAWAGSSLVYVTDRNGAQEIWLHKGDSERPLVTERDFPAGTTQWFMGPSLSPDGNRVIYTRIGRGSGAEVWMSSLTGGSPVAVGSKGNEFGYPGSWSPDGAWFAYGKYDDGKPQLFKVKTSGQAQPELVKAVWGDVPIWSPTGEWILYINDKVRLTSPDGKLERELISKNAIACAFSRDGATVYCLRQEMPTQPGVLLSIPTAGGQEKTIGTFTTANRPTSNLSPSLRLTLTPDGKSLTYATIKFTANLWMLSGIE